MENTIATEGGQVRSQIFQVGGAVVVVTLTVAAFSLTWFTRRKASHSRLLPPGPRGWPVVGSLLSLGHLPHHSLTRLAAQYGPLMFLRLGSKPTLVVSSSQMAKEILKSYDKIMVSREGKIISNCLSYDMKDVACAPYGPHWRRVRKVCTLELFNANRLNQFQGVREREILAILPFILEASQQGSALNMHEIFSNLSTNIMTQIMWNKSHFMATGGSSSAEVTAFQEMIREIFILLGTFNIADYVPVLKPLGISKLQGYDKRMKNVHEKMDKFLQNVIDEHQIKEMSTGTQRDVNEDFVDVLLKPSKQAGSEEVLPIDTVKAILWDMINGGTDTSATLLEWALAELVKNPSIMSKAQDELDLVIGPNRLVKETDIPNLKYIQAVVKEAFRMHPPAPLGIAHKSIQDCEIEGYHIPAGIQVFVNIWAIQRDPAIWERPLDFDPERFLISTVDVKGRDFELLPFGSGRRSCPGINLGLVMVQYSLAQLLHTFSWTLPDDHKPQQLDMSEMFGITCPKAIPLTVLAKLRLPSLVIHSTESLNP